MIGAATEQCTTMSDKLNIANEMRQLDLKNRNFYNELTPEERKKFSNYLMIRWGSAVQGNRELQEYYVQSCNHYFNKHETNMKTKYALINTFNAMPGRLGGNPAALRWLML